MGAVVSAYDVRPAVREQIESLGGKFIPLPETEEKGEGEGGYAREMTPEYLKAQRAIVAEHVAKADVVITTALVPGRKAPMLISKDMVEDIENDEVVDGALLTHNGEVRHAPTKEALEGGSK